MKRSLVLTIAVTAILAWSSVAQAGGYRGHGGYGHYRPHHTVYYGHHGHHGDSDLVEGLAIATGVVVLGSIIYGIHQQNRQAQASYPQAGYPTPPAAPVPAYWYRIDGEGRCVQVTLNSEGREVWTYVDPAYCN